MKNIRKSQSATTTTTAPISFKDIVGRGPEALEVAQDAAFEGNTLTLTLTPEAMALVKVAAAINNAGNVAEWFVDEVMGGLNGDIFDRFSDMIKADA